MIVIACLGGLLILSLFLYWTTSLCMPDEVSHDKLLKHLSEPEMIRILEQCRLHGIGRLNATADWMFPAIGTTSRQTTEEVLDYLDLLEINPLTTPKNAGYYLLGIVRELRQRPDSAAKILSRQF